MSETRSSPVLYPVSAEQAQANHPPASQQSQVTTQQAQPPLTQQSSSAQPQQRVHVIKKNIYLMTSNPGNNSATNGNSGTTSPMVNFLSFFSFYLYSFNCIPSKGIN